jgi:superfamily II RNA helicase
MNDQSRNAPLKRLLTKIPKTGEEPEREQILDLFLEFTGDKNLELYPAQEEAILELIGWKHVILNTPTGSGKSLVAMALHFQAMAEGRISYYTCPIKALVNEKFFDLCDLFGPENVGLLTGDASVNRGAPIICCTAEILANLALRDENLVADYVVMDEFHFYGDKDRGAAWQIPLISLRDTLFLLMSATLGDTSHIESRLRDFTNRDVSTISHAERPVPLEFEYRETPIQETVQDLLEADEAPIYLVNFTQRSCAEQAQALTSVNICSKNEKKEIARQLDTIRFDTPYGKDMQRFLRAGIGIHHAGLLPKYRLLVERLSQAGLLKVICGTDSLGVGVNIPIRTVLFRSLSKYDGEKTRILSARQFHQIAGRAGRKGFDDHGRVVVQAPEHMIANKQLEAKLVKNPHLKNKLKKQKPPTRGYVHWDKSTFGRLRSSPPEPLEPRFEVNHGMIVHAISSDDPAPGGGYRRLMKLIGRAHLVPGARKLQRRRAAALFKALKKADIVHIVPNESKKGATIRVKPDLQYNFSLNQTLSLYLVETLDLLDTEAESYSLDMLSLVEAILENPNVILLRQKDRLKDVLMAKMKAAGASYEERIDALEKVDYPKPLSEFIYSSFNVFAEFHPWVAGENIHPKSVAREMYEKCSSFNDYVKELSATRSEGVLLRYLSQVYKTMCQTIPESYWTEEIEEIQAFLLTAIKRTDSSLIEEWERMMDGQPGARLVVSKEKTQMPDMETIAADFKKLSARIRNELYMLQRSLAVKDYEEAGKLVRQTEANSWSEDAFAEAMTSYFAEHATIDLTPRTRQPVNTFVRETEKRKWEVMQKIIDPEGDEDWALHGVVDLQRSFDEDAPLVELYRIGK